MKFLRGLFVLVLFWFIIFWLRSRYNSERTVSELDVALPVWEKVANRFQDLGLVSSDWTAKASIATTDPAVSTVWTPTLDDTQPGSEQTQPEPTVEPTGPELHPDVTTTILSSAEWDDVIDWFELMGERDSNFSGVVYCAQSIDYCREQVQKQVMDWFNELLEERLWYVYIPFALSFSGEEAYRQWVYLCAQQTSTQAQVRALLQYMSTEPSQRDIDEYVESINIKYADWCPDNTETVDQLRSLRETARNLFDVTQLPSVLIRNTETDKLWKIPGIYEDEEIESTLQAINQSA